MQNKLQNRIKCIFACSVAVMTLLTGCSNRTVTQAVIKSDIDINDTNRIVYDLDSNAKSGLYKSDSKEYGYLSRMKKTISNEYLELYVGSLFDIAVLDKETGKIFFSNKSIYEASADMSDEEKVASFSQVSLEYYNSANQLLKMNSYPDCTDGNEKKQVEVKVEGNAVNMKYKFGTQEKDRLICSAITPETYEAMKAKVDEKVAAQEMSFNQYAKFLEIYKHLYYSDLTDTDKQKYSNMFPNFEKIGELYIFPDDAGDTKKDEMEEISRILAIDKAFIAKENQTIGIKSNISTAKTAYYEIPVTYKLQGRDFVAAIDSSKLTQVTGFMLTRIYLLNNFYSVKPDKNGYLFIPDGSGAIIENSNINNLTKLDVQFYGSDFSTDLSNASMVKPYSSLPVFGIKNENAAVFGIVESGDGLGGVQVQMANSFNPSNSVSPWFTYLTQDSPVDEIMSKQKTVNSAYVYSKKKPDSLYSIRYHFLYGEASTYSGMAKYYQAYLKQLGVLKKDKGNSEITLDLNIIGAITKKKIVAGVPMNVEVAASSFKDVKKMSEEIKNSNISNFNILYQGAINGGMNSMSPQKVNIENSLGGKTEYLKLQDYLTSVGSKLILDVDFMKVYRQGNGLNQNNQLSSFPNKKFSFISGYYSNTNERDNDTAAYIVNPMSYITIINSFAKSHSALNNKSIYTSSIGSYLNGNYNEKYEITREESKNLTVNAFKRIKELGYEITADGGNAYSLKYIDHLTDLPADYSNFSIESYSVPFAAMVLHGYIDYSGPLLNQQGNYKKALLKNIENGAGLNYLLMTGNELVLTNTNYSDFYSVSTTQWLNEIINTYKKLSGEFKAVKGSTITKHTKLADNVFETTYSNGTKVIVNYNDEAFAKDSIKVNGMDYLFVSGS